VLKVRVNHCGKMPLGHPPFSLVMEPGLKARTKASLSTSGGSKHFNKRRLVATVHLLDPN
jgi:hypothetical protein